MTVLTVKKVRYNIMGYTHYWEIKPTVNKKQYKLALAKIRELIELYKHKIPVGNTAGGYYSEYTEEILAGGHGEKPIKKSEYRTWISFNGLGDMSHETFSLPSTALKDTGFSFCKTARKPYDVIVVASLAILKHYLADEFKFTSDGSIEDLIDGFKLAQSLLPEIDFYNVFLDITPRFKNG